MHEPVAARRIPAPRHVRMTALSLFALGFGLAFLGILTLRLPGVALSAKAPELAVAAAAAALVAVWPWAGPRTPGDLGRELLEYVTACGVASAAALLALSAAGPGQLAAWVPFALLGLACGGAVRLCWACVAAMVPMRHATSLMGLFGLSAGCGGIAATLLVLAAPGRARLDIALLCAAGAPLLLVAASLGAKAVRVRPAADRLTVPARPPRSEQRGLLLAASLSLQMAACVIAASWLPSYLSRRLGYALAGAALTLVLFWTGMIVGWVCASRMPSVRADLRPVGCALALAVGGAALLLNRGAGTGTALGTLVLGLAAGLLLALTLRLEPWPAPVGSHRWVTRSFQLGLPCALAASSAAGALVGATSAALAAWAILVCVIAGVGTLTLAILDSRVTGDSVVV